MAAIKPIVQDLGQQATKANLMAAHTGWVHSNIHTVVCVRYSAGGGLHAVNVTYSFLVLCLASLCHGAFVSRPLTLLDYSLRIIFP